MDKAFASDSEEEYDEEEDLSSDLGSSEEEFGIIDYDNELTRDIWLPSEPRLFVLYLGG